MNSSNSSSERKKRNENGLFQIDEEKRDVGIIIMNWTETTKMYIKEDKETMLTSGIGLISRKGNLARRLKSVLQLSLLLTLFVGLANGPVLAQNGDEAAAIATMLQQRDKQIKTLLGDKSKLAESETDELRSVVNDVISFKAMGEASLGRHWKKLSPEQQSEFIDVFSQIVRAQSLADLNPYRAKISYGDVVVDGSSATVSTKGSLDQVSTDIDYKMIKVGNEWKVEDISLDQVSTVKGYSRSFQSVVRKKGFDALMTSLNKKLAKVG